MVLIGGPGTGKTYIATAERAGHRAASPTGALLLDGGTGQRAEQEKVGGNSGHINRRLMQRGCGGAR